LDLFNNSETTNSEKQPLAHRMRPRDLNEFVGQEHIVGESGFLKSLLSKGVIPSLIFWGPPGSGKTTLAVIIAGYIKADFIALSAVSSGVKEIKGVVERASLNLRNNKKTILFVDEIHRFNKSQQDAFLPYVEDGTIILIGATTENPSFEVISALLSRSKVITLKALTDGDIKKIIDAAVTDKERGFGGKKIKISEDAYILISRICNGDARVALNIIEMIDALKASDEYEISINDIKQVMERKTFLYDKSGEEHYNLISALHKSLRDSDPDAALYWMTRMLDSGEDALYIARRMVRFASEDIGNADPGALRMALSAKEAFDFLGHPEGELALAQACLYLACAPKSNAAYTAFGAAQNDVRNYRDEPVPLHIRNAPTKLMKDLGYGEGYKYAHNYEGNFVEQEHMPDKLKGHVYYKPTDNGVEAKIKERLENWRKNRGQNQQ
jgi:putative ATPase